MWEGGHRLITSIISDNLDLNGIVRRVDDGLDEAENVCCASLKRVHKQGSPNHSDQCLQRRFMRTPTAERSVTHAETKPDRTKERSLNLGAD